MSLETSKSRKRSRLKKCPQIANGERSDRDRILITCTRRQVFVAACSPPSPAGRQLAGGSWLAAAGHAPQRFARGRRSCGCMLAAAAGGICHPNAARAARRRLHSVARILRASTWSRCSRASRSRAMATSTDGVGEASLSCDYLVVGAGASGMSFLDSLLKHHPDSKCESPRHRCCMLPPGSECESPRRRCCMLLLVLLLLDADQALGCTGPSRLSSWTSTRSPADTGTTPTHSSHCTRPLGTTAWSRWRWRRKWRTGRS